MRESLYSHCMRIGKKCLLEEWADDSCTPATVSYGSKRRVWWACKKGHRWQAAISDRIGGSGCPYCSGRLVQTGINDLKTRYPDVAAQWHPTKNGDLRSDRVSGSSNRKVWWRCVNGHEWQAVISSRTAGCGCPYCTGKRAVRGYTDLATLFPELAAEWAEMNDGCLSPGDVSPHSNKKVWWRCKRGHTWQATVNARVRDGSDCPYCSNRKVWPGFNDLKTREPLVAAQWYQALNGDVTPETVLPGTKRSAWWICPLGHVWQARISSRTGNQKTGCPVCAGNVRRKRYPR